MPDANPLNSPWKTRSETFVRTFKIICARVWPCSTLLPTLRQSNDDFNQPNERLRVISCPFQHIFGRHAGFVIEAFVDMFYVEIDEKMGMSGRRLLHNRKYIPPKRNFLEYRSKLPGMYFRITFRRGEFSILPTFI